MIICLYLVLSSCIVLVILVVPTHPRSHLLSNTLGIPSLSHPQTPSLTHLSLSYILPHTISNPHPPSLVLPTDPLTLTNSDDKNNDDRLRYRNRTGEVDDDLIDDDDDDDDDDDSTDEFDASVDKCAVHVEHWGSLSPQVSSALPSLTRSHHSHTILQPPHPTPALLYASTVWNMFYIAVGTAFFMTYLLTYPPPPL